MQNQSIHLGVWVRTIDRLAIFSDHCIQGMISSHNTARVFPKNGNKLHTGALGDRKYL